MDLQIDDFYLDTAAALLRLYHAFPRKVGLYVDDLIGQDETDEFGLPSLRHQACLGTLLWLADEGYMRYESVIPHQALDQAVLSEKGFLRLSRALPQAQAISGELPPSVVRVQATLAHQLREALASRHGERIAGLSRLLFEQGPGERGHSLK